MPGPITRAKFMCTNASLSADGTSETISMSAVVSDHTDQSDTEHYSSFTPSGALSIMVTNPNLIGSFGAGCMYYLDITAADTKAQALADAAQAAIADANAAAAAAKQQDQGAGQQTNTTTAAAASNGNPVPQGSDTEIFDFLGATVADADLSLLQNFAAQVADSGACLKTIIINGLTVTDSDIATALGLPPGLSVVVGDGGMLTITPAVINTAQAVNGTGADAPVPEPEPAPEPTSAAAEDTQQTGQ